MPESLEVVFAVCLSTQGLWNCLVWISSKVYKQEIKKFCCRVIRSNALSMRYV